MFLSRTASHCLKWLIYRFYSKVSGEEHQERSTAGSDNTGCHAVAVKIPIQVQKFCLKAEGSKYIFPSVAHSYPLFFISERQSPKLLMLIFTWYFGCC